MIYNRERFRNYSNWIIGHRWHVTLTMFFMLVWMLSGFEAKFAVNDTSLWISGSKEQLRNETESIAPLHQLKLVYELGEQKGFDAHIALLRDLHREIGAVEGVRDVRSVLTLGRPFNNSVGEGSGLLEIGKLCDADPKELRQVLKKYYGLYRPYADAELKHFYIYIFADSEESLDAVRSLLNGTFIFTKEASVSYLYTVALIVLLTALLFWAVFRNVIPALLSATVTTATLVTTLYLAQQLFGIERVHLTVTLLTLAIAQMDFIYFYYRWHVSQFKVNPREALHKTINRNAVPAFLTSAVTAIGLGSLLLIDIPILQQIGVFALLSAFLGFLFSVIWLPALLSFFRIDNAVVPFARFSAYFAAREIHYNRRLLALFLALVLVGALAAGSAFLSEPPKIFDARAQNDTVTLAVPFDEIDGEAVALLERFGKELSERFGDVQAVESIAAAVRRMARIEGNAPLDEEHIGRYLFFIELYGESERIWHDGTAMVHVWLRKGSDEKSGVVAWAREWSHSGKKLHLVDRDSLAYAAKSDDAVIMAVSVVTALLLIGVIMLMVTRKYQLLLISWIVNVIPMVGFALMILLFRIPLSVEILIAVTIMLGLASDATIHFSYKYMQSRHFYHKRIKALEKVFFYAGVPVIVGNLLLAALFFLLAATGSTTLQTIGLYAGLLTLMSLAVDLFVLPVMLLYVDKNHALEE